MHKKREVVAWGDKKSPVVVNDSLKVYWMWNFRFLQLWTLSSTFNYNTIAIVCSLRLVFSIKSRKSIVITGHKERHNEEVANRITDDQTSCSRKVFNNWTQSWSNRYVPRKKLDITRSFSKPTTYAYISWPYYARKELVSFRSLRNI